LRATPDFIIVGAQKSGTTSLYHYLVNHPCIAPAWTKEIHFFDLHYSQGTAWYQAHFPIRWQKVTGQLFRNSPVMTGEASPYYLFHPHAPRRIKALAPWTKLIVLLRNPIDRAYSHYYHEVCRGREKLSFDEAIEQEPCRLEQEWPRVLADETYYSFAHQHYSYLARGLYVDQLQRFEMFFPKHQILVLESEAFYAQPAVIVQRVTRFLGLPDWDLTEARKYNAGEYQKMEQVTRQRLIDYFKPHNERLYQHLGVGFGWDA